MKASLNWIKEFTKITLTPEELKERLSVSLTEVEGIEDYAQRFNGIIVAVVEEVRPHETSPDLLVLKLDIGSRHVSVVVQTCPVKKGDKVPYLPPGSVVPGEIGGETGGQTVAVAEVKGVASEGFVPSGRELGLNYDHTNVYILPDDAKVGSPVSQLLDLTDYILEIKNKALTNRPDVFCVEGLAREIAAVQASRFKGLSWISDFSKLKQRYTISEEDQTCALRIDNQVHPLCPRYIAVVLDNVTIAPSPVWMQVRLAKHGIRPVNNVVDISNYLMIEAGQPSHTFDYDKVVKKDTAVSDGAVLTVRTAKGGETITTIDGQHKTLEDGMVIIADSQNPIGVAGVMGGKDTEISDETTRVIFQVENLDMYSVRRTSMALGIFSEAVTRFSRGLDPNRCEAILYKGIDLLHSYAGAEVASSVLDDYETPLLPQKISFDPQRSRNRIGSDISDETMTDIFERLSFDAVSERKSPMMTITAPTFRRDIRIQEDLDEEVVRIFGYDRIVPTLPLRTITPIPQNPCRKIRMLIKDTLRACGAHEIYTYSFVGENVYETCRLSLEGAKKLLNPISPDLQFMRPLLVPSVIEKVPVNASHADRFVLFETDMVNPIKEIENGTRALPVEPWHLACVHTDSFFALKAYLDEIRRSLNLPAIEFLPAKAVERGGLPSWVQYAEQGYLFGHLAYIRLAGSIVGLIGEIIPSCVSEMKLPQGISAFEVRLDDIEPHVQEVPQYRDPSHFPSVVHDMCFVTNRNVLYSELHTAVASAGEGDGVIKEIECRDIYTGVNGSSEKKSDDGKAVKKTTFRITMQSDEKTLNEDDIASIREEIVESVQKRVNGSLCA